MKKLVFMSVKIHNYFSTLDLIAKKEEFIKIVNSYFEKCSLGNSKQKEELIKRIKSSNERELLNLIDMFFGIDKYYFLWYSKKEVELEHLEGFIYQEHEKACDDLYRGIDDLTRILLENSQMIEKRKNYQNNLESFMTSMVDYDISGFEKKNSERKLFGLSKVKDNKNQLCTLFGELSLIDGVIQYFRYIIGLEPIINIAKCFDLYFKDRYGEDTKYVSLDIFIKNFIKDIMAFYKARMDEIDTIIGENQVRINNCSLSLKREATEVKRGAKVQKEINLSVNSAENYKIAGMSDEEEQKLFLDIREYLITEFEGTLDLDEEFSSPLLKKV